MFLRGNQTSRQTTPSIKQSRSKISSGSTSPMEFSQCVVIIEAQFNPTTFPFVFVFNLRI